MKGNLLFYTRRNPKLSGPRIVGSVLKDIIENYVLSIFPACQSQHSICLFRLTLFTVARELLTFQTSR
jgi:hypothetical protein